MYHDRVSEHREMSRVNRAPLMKNKKPRSGHGCSVHTDNDCRVNRGRDETLHERSVDCLPSEFISSDITTEQTVYTIFYFNLFSLAKRY